LLDCDWQVTYSPYLATNSIGLLTSFFVVQIGQVPSILIINKVDTAAAATVNLPEYVTQTFSAVVLTCALQSVGIQDLESAVLNLIGAGDVNPDGRQWAVNQV
jgi:predicted GTPase